MDRGEAMKILITGNLGYVGPVVAHHLRRAYPNAHLIGFDSAFFALSTTGAMELPERVLDEQHFGDIRDLPERLLDGVDAASTWRPYLTTRWAIDSKA